MTTEAPKTSNADVSAKQSEDEVLHALHQANVALAKARSRPVSTLLKYLEFKLLTLFSKASPPLPGSMTRRFARSAFKRHPQRSLRDANAILDTDPGAFKGDRQRSLRDANAILDADPMMSVSSVSEDYKGEMAQRDDRPNIVIATHQLSRTGAPILSLNLCQALSDSYNITVVSLRSGELLPDFRKHATQVKIIDKDISRGGYKAVSEIIARVIGDKDYAFGLVNSIESILVLGALKSRGIPSVILLHEFASYTYNKDVYPQALADADRVVFSTKLTLDDAVNAAGIEVNDKVSVLPQGKCVVPGGADADPEAGETERQRLRDLLRPEGSQGRFIVIGAGTVEIRKGVDLFIETARRVLDHAPDREILFVWIGGGYKPTEDMLYSAFLADQLKRSGLSEKVMMLPPTPEIETVYELADVMALTPRLDPLPNVAIDAMRLGKPVLCFEDTSGVAEILVDAGLQDTSVPRYLDTSDMAEKILRLALDSDHFAHVAETTKDHGDKVFDFPAYARQLEALALEVSAK